MIGQRALRLKRTSKTCCIHCHAFRASGLASAGLWALHNKSIFNLAFLLCSGSLLTPFSSSTDIVWGTSYWNWIISLLLAISLPFTEEMATTASLTSIDFEGGHSSSAQLLYIKSFPLYFITEYTLAPFVPKVSDLLKRVSISLRIFSFSLLRSDLIFKKSNDGEDGSLD